MYSTLSFKSEFTYGISSITLEGWGGVPFGETGRQDAQWVTWLGQMAGERQHHPSTHLLTPRSMLVPQRDRPMEVWVLTRMLTRHVPLTRHWSSLPLTLSSAEGGTRMPITRGLGEGSASWGEMGRNGCLRLGSTSHLGTKGIQWEGPSQSHGKWIWVPSLLLLYFSPIHTPPRACLLGWPFGMANVPVFPAGFISASSLSEMGILEAGSLWDKTKCFLFIIKGIHTYNWSSGKSGKKKKNEIFINLKLRSHIQILKPPVIFSCMLFVYTECVWL